MKFIFLNTILNITLMEVSTSIYTQSKEGRKDSGESCNRFTRALFVTNSHTSQPRLTNTRGLNTLHVKRQRFFLIQYTLNLIKTTPFLLRRNGGVLFNSSFVFSYKTIRHRLVESSRWSSFFFLMV